MNVRVPLAVFALAAVGSAAVAQLDRRDRAEPEIVLDHGGRVGFCDMMRWDAAGKFLYAGGDDKCVTVWPVDLTAAGGPQLRTDRAVVKSLRWPSWREKRGGVKNFATHPNGEKVAVGGVGMIASAVGVLSRTDSTAAETVVDSYTWPRSNGENFGTVTAVAYSPDGNRIAFGTADGSLWVWTPAKLAEPEPRGPNEQADRSWSTPLRAGKHTTPGEWDKTLWATTNLFSRSRLVFFRDENTLVSVSMSGQVVACDVSASAKLSDKPGAPIPAAKELFHLNAKGTAPDRVYRAELTPDGQGLAVAFMGPRVRVCDLTGEGTDLPLQKGLIPYSVAVGPDGRTAVAVGGPEGGVGGDPRFYVERAHEVWVYEKGQAKPADVLKTGRAEAVAFHPTRKGLLAVAGGDADEVRLFDLSGKTPAEPTSVVRGAGRKIFAVAIGGDAVVAVKVQPDPTADHPNALASGEWVGYDLSRQRAAALPKELATARNEADGWKVTPDDAPAKDRLRSRWYAVGPDGQKAELTFNHSLYNDPTCYTFLPKTADHPTRLLVGHAHGCSLFVLPADKPAKIAPTAVYVGHTTEVLSVAAAKDGTWFVSGGADHTVAAFSLKEWDGHPTLGATFAVNAKQELRVTAVATGSPAWEAGLKEGERVVRVGLGGDVRVYSETEGDGWKAVGTPADAAKVLSAPAGPGRQLYLMTDGPKDDNVRLTSVQQRPVWKWFPAFAADSPRVTDSVVWMWKGSWYHAETTNGDGMAGWHVNAKDVIGSPRFLRLRELAEHYRKPLLIRELLQKRDVAGALNTALGKNPQPLKFSKFEPEPVKLIVRTKQTDGGKVAVRVTVNPIGSNPDLLPERVELWVNDYRMERVNTGGVKAFEKEFTIDAGQLRAGDNQITVMTHNRLGGRARDSDVVTNTKEPAADPLLVGWVGGVNDYLGKNARLPADVRAAFGDLNPLKFAVPDAKAISTRFDANSGKERLYRENQLKLKTDADVKQKPLLDELDRLAEPGAVRPDDTLVIFLAGHGVLIGDVKGKPRAIPLDEKRPEETYTNIRFAFCGIDFDPLNPTTTGVPAEVLFDKLVSVNCRKLVFLDVCHAGGVMDVDVIRQLLPDGQGPFVFAACGRGELSREDASGEHGLFTRALLDATGDQFPFADRNRDGALSCQELVEFCTRQVRELRVKGMKAKDPAAKNSDQNPVNNLPFATQPRVAVFKRLVK
jgi:WD40 repeat protein